MYFIRKNGGNPNDDLIKKEKKGKPIVVISAVPKAAQYKISFYFESSVWLRSHKDLIIQVIGSASPSWHIIHT